MADPASVTAETAILGDANGPEVPSWYSVALRSRGRKNGDGAEKQGRSVLTPGARVSAMCSGSSALQPAQLLAVEDPYWI